MPAKKRSTLLEQLADLEDPVPKDFDPESEPFAPNNGDASDGEIDAEERDQAAREHYVQVDNSKLRRRDEATLGPQYAGSRVARNALDDEEEDDPFSRGYDESDSEEAEEEADEINGEEKHDDISEHEDESSEEDMDEEEMDESAAQRQDDGFDRAELQKMMAEEHKTVAASLSQAAKADAEKGRAVKRQRSTFDTLLNTRIKLQKTLISTNTLAGLGRNETESSTADLGIAFEAAEQAALTFWSNITALRDSLYETQTGQKRKRSQSSTSTADLYSYVREQSTSSRPRIDATLEKWSLKSRGVQAIATRNKLNNTSSQSTVTDVLKQHLMTNPDRLLKRTRTPRSCAPYQLARKVQEDSGIYDDADFYGLLLQSLLEQRSADSVAAVAAVDGNGGLSNGIDARFQLRRDAKTKRNVDTRASKGRKLRYTVHEKLMNFMAPEDRGTWETRQADELFGSLFGRKMGLEEDVAEDESDVEEAGLRLFRT